MKEVYLPTLIKCALVLWSPEERKKKKKEKKNLPDQSLQVSLQVSLPEGKRSIFFRDFLHYQFVWWVETDV